MNCHSKNAEAEAEAAAKALCGHQNFKVLEFAIKKWKRRKNYHSQKYRKQQNINNGQERAVP